MEDLTVLLMAVVSFSLFFASVAVAYAAGEARERGERLSMEAEDFLEAVITDPRWTSGRGLLLAAKLTNTSAEIVTALAGSLHGVAVIWNLEAGERWAFGEGSEGDRWTAATSANVLGTRVDPARVVVTVWGP